MPRVHSTIKFPVCGLCPTSTILTSIQFTYLCSTEPSAAARIDYPVVFISFGLEQRNHSLFPFQFQLVLLSYVRVFSGVQTLKFLSHRSQDDSR